MNPSRRRKLPIVTGVIDYFPDAIIEVAAVSLAGNAQHNPGEPLHWTREKSADHADALLGHLIERGKFDTDGTRHSAKTVWRSLALLQLEIEQDKKTEQAKAELTATPVAGDGLMPALGWFSVTEDSRTYFYKDGETTFTDVVGVQVPFTGEHKLFFNNGDSCVVKEGWVGVRLDSTECPPKATFVGHVFDDEDEFLKLVLKSQGASDGCV